MGKLFDDYHPERHYMRGPGPKWLEKQGGGFACPDGDRKARSLQYKLGYRGYDLEVARDVSVWRVRIYTRHPELPILGRCEVYSQNQDEAVVEAKRRVDAALLL
jgi:hypothetical protein